MRHKKLAYNTVFSLLLQISTVICGFILPKLIIDHYGSEVNGLVNSITQFLSVIAFLEFGVGAVFQSSLYKPLAERDYDAISKVYVSGQRFFTRLTIILLFYVVSLMVIYPFIAKQKFGFAYTSALIMVMSISTIAQYYVGMTNGLLLNADQKGYIGYGTQIITLFVNTVACFILVRFNASIHVLKLSTALIYLARPFVAHVYVKKHYKINKRIEYDVEPIKQKWNGLAQHVSTVILESTDTVVLTIFSTFSYVSVYSVYYLVISGVKQLFLAATAGLQSYLGELYAKKDDRLDNAFSLTEWGIHAATTFAFGCTLILIVPFVMIYTKGISDADYYQPIFAICIVLAYELYCYRLPYHILVKAAGHYAQTQWCYLFAAVLNVIVSVIMVNIIGLTGVAIGTMIATGVQTIWMARYVSKKLVFIRFWHVIRQFTCDAIIMVLGSLATYHFIGSEGTYLEWFGLAIKVACIWLGISGAVNLVFFGNSIKKWMKREKNKKTRIFDHGSSSVGIIENDNSTD